MISKKITLIITIITVVFNYQIKSQTESTLKPNIVWIMMEDWGYQLSCYGEKGIYTPNIDNVANDGIMFVNSFCTSPVCSPSRSAMMTGFHQNYIGAEQHRTRGEFKKKHLPYNIKPISQLLEEAGYFTCIMNGFKTDLNFLVEGELFQGTDWNQRTEGQPFFAQITFGGTHRTWKRDKKKPIDITKVELPPYYPQTDLAKRDWANGLEAAQIVDRQIGKVLNRLDNEGLRQNTLVFIIGDNGRCMPRGKQFLYDGGIQVPIIARWPEKIKAGQKSEDMVTTIDISKTILDIAGAKPRHPLHGKNLFNGETADRKYIFAARDKMDDTHDAMRAIRSKKFKLIHNLMPERAYCQYNYYKESKYPVLALLNIMHMKGELTPEQAKFMAPSKPEFELYNMVNDPFELVNLADNPEYKHIKDTLLKELNQWRLFVKDKGVSKEFRSGGSTSKYPTKTLEEWEAVLQSFNAWVYREPGAKLVHPSKVNKKKKKK